MTVHNAATRILLLLTVTLSTAAQWADPVPSPNPELSADNHDTLLTGSRLPADGVGERVHTVFDRAEQDLAKTSFPSEAESASAPGTVSVAELRHRMSRAGANLIKQAQRYATEGKHLKAIEVLKQALQESSSQPYALGLLGIEYLKLGDIQASITHLKQAVVLMPSLAANHSNLGNALCRIGDTTSGEKEIREAIRADSNLPIPHFLLGVILLNRDTPGARDQLLLAHNQVNSARLALAVYYVRRGETEAAQEELKGYLQRNHSVDSSALEGWVAYVAALLKPAVAFGFPSQASLPTRATIEGSR